LGVLKLNWYYKNSNEYSWGL